MSYGWLYKSFIVPYCWTYCNMSAMWVQWLYLYTSRGASALFVLRDRAMREPSVRGMSNSRLNSTFFYVYTTSFWCQ